MNVQDVYAVSMAGKAMDISKMSGQLIQRTQQEVAEKASQSPPPPPPASEIVENHHVDVVV